MPRPYMILKAILPDIITLARMQRTVMCLELGRLYPHGNPRLLKLAYPCRELKDAEFVCSVIGGDAAVFLAVVHYFFGLSFQNGSSPPSSSSSSSKLPVRFLYSMLSLMMSWIQEGISSIIESGDSSMSNLILSVCGVGCGIPFGSFVMPPRLAYVLSPDLL